MTADPLPPSMRPRATPSVDKVLDEIEAGHDARQTELARTLSAAGYVPGPWTRRWRRLTRRARMTGRRGV